MDLYVLFGIAAAIAFLLIISYLLSEEHLAIKSLLMLISFWFVFAMIGIWRAAAEADITLAPGISEIATAVYWVFLFLSFAITIYALIYVFVAFYKHLFIRMGKNG